MKLGLRYLVCTTPRSGSTYLCHLLGRTGALGMQPYDERRFEYCKRFVQQGGPSARDGRLVTVFEDAFVESATPNGVAGFKVMWEHLDRVIAALAHSGAGSRAELERRLASETRFIRLRRRDELSQAVSWNRALQSDGWHYLAEQKFEGRYVYDFPGIALGIRRVRRAERAWRRFFERAGVEPLTLYYEDYLEDVPGAVQRIAAYLGVELAAPVDASPGTLRIQRDERNAEWARRYREDARTPLRAALAVLRAVGSREWRESYRTRRASQMRSIETSPADRRPVPDVRNR